MSCPRKPPSPHFSTQSSDGILNRLASACGIFTEGGASRKGYEKMSQSTRDSVAIYRLREAVSAINLLLPAPISLETAIRSADGVRKLVKGQNLAKTYSSCLRKLECLKRHVPGFEHSSLDAVVETHIENVKRMADACAAALLHMYMSVDTSEGVEAFTEHAIKLTAATEITMQDLTMAEKALGLKPKIGPYSVQDVHDSRRKCHAHGLSTDSFSNSIDNVCSNMQIYDGCLIGCGSQSIKNTIEDEHQYSDEDEYDPFRMEKTTDKQNLCQRHCDATQSVLVLPNPPSDLGTAATKESKGTVASKHPSGTRVLE